MINLSTLTLGRTPDRIGSLFGLFQQEC
jgi:hypothetical protein